MKRILAALRAAADWLRGPIVPDRERTPTELEDAQILAVEAILRRLRDAGFIVDACDYHGRDHLVASVHGNELLCGECLNDGDTGELSDLGLDSTAIEIVEAIQREIGRRVPV